MIRILCLFLMISFFLSSQWCEISYGNESLPTGRESLIDKYHKIENELEKSPFDIPFYIESSMSNNASHVDIYGTINYPFDIVQNELQVPTNWCEIVLSLYFIFIFYQNIDCLSIRFCQFYKDFLT